MRKIILTLAACASLAASAQANLIITPPQPTNGLNYTNQFAETDPANIYSYSDTAGPGSTAGIAITTPTGGVGTTNWITYTNGFTFTTDAAQYASLMFNYSQGSTPAFGADVRIALGFSASGNVPGEGGTGTAFRLFAQGGTGTNLTPAIRNNGSTINPSGQTPVSLTNTWYQMLVSLTKTATADTFNYTYALNQYDTNGSSYVANIFNYTGSLTNAGSYINTRYISFYGGNDDNGTGATAFANLSTVPEPSTYALLALAGAGLGAHVLRRRRG